MRIEGRELVRVPRAEVWRRLNDPAVIQRCTPGLTELRETSPDHYEAVLEVKLPAVSGRFTGAVDFVERREPERMRLRLRGKGSPGFVDGEAELELVERDGGTEIAYRADVQIGGGMARMGQRMLSGITREMAGQFFDEFQRLDSDGPARAAPSPWRAFLQLVWRMLRRWIGLPPAR